MRELESVKLYIMRLEDELDDLNPDDPDIQEIEKEIARMIALRDELIRELGNTEQ